MSYYDWQHLTKPWTITPVEQDTVENTKPLSITPVDDVTPKFITLLIPEFSFNVANLLFGNVVMVGNLQPPQMIGQFNYSVANPFSLNGTDQIYDEQLAYCVRWRYGGYPDGSYDKTYRYLLGDRWEQYEQYPQRLPFPLYKGQAVQPNFVIEVWLKRIITIENDLIDSGQIILPSGILYYPTDADMPTPQVTPAQIVQLADLTTPVSVVPPQAATQENVPTAVNPAGPWLTNGQMQGPP